MDRSIAELKCAFIDLARTRIDAHVFCFSVFRTHASKTRHAQVAIGLDLRDHRAECIHVRLQKQSALPGFLAAEVDQNTAFFCFLRGKAERCKRLLHPLSRFVRKARRAVDCKQLDCLFHCVSRIVLFHCFQLPS